MSRQLAAASRARASAILSRALTLTAPWRCSRSRRSSPVTRARRMPAGAAAGVLAGDGRSQRGDVEHARRSSRSKARPMFALEVGRAIRGSGRRQRRPVPRRRPRPGIAVVHALSWILRAVAAWLVIAVQAPRAAFPAEPRRAGVAAEGRGAGGRPGASRPPWLMQGPFVMFRAHAAHPADLGIVALVLRCSC